MNTAPHTFSRDELRCIALLALLVAHGADAELDPREIDAIAERLMALESGLDAQEVMAVFRGASKIYALKDLKGDELIADLAESLDQDGKHRAFAALRGVAEADGLIHPGEFTLLRHVAEVWGLGPEVLDERWGGLQDGR